jgi:hypothetical protein
LIVLQKDDNLVLIDVNLAAMIVAINKTVEVDFDLILFLFWLFGFGDIYEDAKQNTIIEEI